MALIVCQECGGQMSEQAQSCPKCGAPNPNAPQVAHTQFAYAAQAVSGGTNFNPCARHPQAPAVATCGNCGANMCKECKDLSVYTKDNKPVCIDCTLQYNEATLTHLRSEIRWAKVKTIILGVIILIALSLWLNNLGDTNAAIWAWIIAALGGIFTTLKHTGRSDAERAADDIYTRFNPSDGLMYEGVGCFARIAVAVFFAPFVTLYSFVKNIFTWVTSQKNLKISEQNHADYIEILKQRGEL